MVVDMIRFVVMISVGLLLLAGCNQKTEGTTAQASAPAAAKPVVEATEAAAPAVPSLAGTVITAATGTELTVLSVGEFDQSWTELSGQVAIEGRVQEVYPERGALVLVDFDSQKDCADCDSCVQTTLPVRLAVDEYEGSFPGTETVIVMTGSIAPNETGGYDFTLAEIRQGEETLLSRTAVDA